MIRKVEFSRDDYESRVLLELKEAIRGNSELRHQGNLIWIEDIQLYKSAPICQVHILFREETRPECLFGFWAEAIECGADALADSIVLNPLRGFWGPEGWASIIIATHFEDQIQHYS